MLAIRVFVTVILLSPGSGMILLASLRAQEPVDSLWTRTVGEDWPEFLGKNRTSTSSEKGILKDWSDGKLKIVWTHPLTESYGIGSVAKGRMFQLDRVEDDEVLFCLNAETGALIWSRKYPTEYEDLYGYNGGPRTSPVVDEDLVYTYGVDGWLRCHQVVDGKLLWKENLNKKYGVVQNFFGVGSTPVIYKNLLIVMVGGSPAESHELPPGAIDRVKGNGSGIVALDKKSGKQVYSVTDELASYASLSLSKIDNRDWCFAFCRGGLIGLDPATGKQRFHYPWRSVKLESVNASNPVIVNDHVFISETYGPGSTLLKIEGDQAKVVWKDDMRSRKLAMQTHWNTAVHHDGFLYGSSGRHTANAELRCIEWKTGKIKWSAPRLSRSSLLLVEDHLICLTEYGRLFLLKANSEKPELITEIELHRMHAKNAKPDDKPLLSYPCWAAPILSHGLLYVRGDKHLICLDLIPEKKEP